MSRLPRVPSAEPAVSFIEMRTSPRHPIVQRCFVHVGGIAPPEGWRCIAYNLSTTGIGITLPSRLPAGTVLSIEPWELPRARTLRTRVVHARPVELLWFTGCELHQRLSDAELQIWCSGQLDWLDGSSV